MAVYNGPKNFHPPLISRMTDTFSINRHQIGVLHVDRTILVPIDIMGNQNKRIVFDNSLKSHEQEQSHSSEFLMQR